LAARCPDGGVDRIKCDNIDLVRAHLIRYRTHIQHTRANKYSYPSAVPLSLRPQLLRRATTVSCTPLVAASDSHTRCSHTHVPRSSPCPCRRPRATGAPTARVHTGGEISTNITRGSPHRHIRDTAAHDPGDQFRVPWPQKYHHARTSVGYCKGISASACRRRAHEFATRPCRKPLPRSANPNPTGLRDSTSGRPRVGAGGVVPYPLTHGSCLVLMLGPGHAETPTKTLPQSGRANPNPDPLTLPLLPSVATRVDGRG
jgi:hypothetical protein